MEAANYAAFLFFESGELVDYGLAKKLMRTFIAITLWFLLLVLCWPLAIVLLFLFPLIWLILLPFRIVGFTLDVVFKIVKGILLFPFKLLKIV